MSSPNTCTKKQIPLNVNALGDHHALGIIDNFAGRIKRILTALFLDNSNTRWIHAIGAIVKRYNRSPHEALSGISPDDATKKAHESMILDIHIAKNRTRTTFSDLKIGDYVRKNLIFNDRNSKGTDPEWSGKVSAVIRVDGNTITLN